MKLRDAENIVDRVMGDLKRENERDTARMLAAPPLELTTDERIQCAKGLNEILAGIDKCKVDEGAPLPLRLLLLTPELAVRRLRAKLLAKPMEAALERFMEEQIASAAKLIEEMKPEKEG